MFSIHSVRSDRELVFRDHKDDSFDVELKGSGLSAMVGVWEYNRSVSLDSFFRDLAKLTTPWKDIHTWKSLEEDFSLSASCSSLGQVIFMVTLRHLTGSPEDWRVVVGLETEFGQLEKIAKDAEDLFQNKSA